MPHCRSLLRASTRPEKITRISVRQPAVWATGSSSFGDVLAEPSGRARTTQAGTGVLKNPLLLCRFGCRSGLRQNRSDRRAVDGEQEGADDDENHFVDAEVRYRYELYRQGDADRPAQRSG